MLTRRKARVAVRPEAAHAALPALPLPCVLDVLSRLPPGERLLCMAVSRAWRAAVCQPSLCASVDLTREFVAPHTASDALLATVVSKAAGQMRSLKLCLRRGGVSTAAVLAAVMANARALRRLDVQGLPLTANDYSMKSMSKGDVDILWRAAPSLLSFATDVWCAFQDAQALLAGQKQYSVVHVRRLFLVRCSHEETMLLGPALRLLSSLQELGLKDTLLDTAAVLGALVDAAIACGLTGLFLGGWCTGSTIDRATCSPAP